MKNMRKGLVAAATALTVSLAGVSVATAEPLSDLENQTVTDLSGTADDQTTLTVTAEADTDVEETDASADLSSGSSDMEAKEIREWIGIFTAVIGAMSTLFAFINKL